MRLMESKDIVVKHVRDRVVKIRPQMVIQKNAEKKLSDPIRSGVACEGWQGHLVCQETR
jgi:hypothetical protein